MRFAWVPAAMTALWVQPAGAVQIYLSSPDYETGAHQKVTLTGLTGADTIKAEGDLGNIAYYYWSLSGSTWSIGGQNGGGVFNCATTTHCDYALTLQSDVYPVSATALLSISIVGQEIFVDWTKAAGDICAQISEAERVDGPQHKCGYAWQDPKVYLDIKVDGPSANTFGYSVSDVVPSGPVPEPATWVLIIMGIGLAGSAMRRRQRRAVTYNFG